MHSSMHSKLSDKTVSLSRRRPAGGSIINLAAAWSLRQARTSCRVPRISSSSSQSSGALRKAMARRVLVPRAREHRSERTGLPTGKLFGP